MSSSDSVRLRILLLTHSFSPDFTPPQRRWKAFTKVFAAHGNSVTVVAPKSGTGSPNTDEPGIRVLQYPNFGNPKHLFLKVLRSLLRAITSLPVCLLSGRQDVVIATVPALSTLVSGLIASRLLRARFVVDLRDSWPNLLSESNILRSRKLEPMVTQMILALLRRADLVAVVTGGLGEVARKQGVRNVVVISNGVDLSNYVSPIPTIRREDGLLHVLYLGNLGRSQGLELIIHAASHLSSEILVRFVGDGTERVRLQNLAASLNAPVEFFHPVRGEQVLEQYAWADTCAVSLRPDWPSFEHTVPSKLYELLFLDRYVTGLVRGEAARIIKASHAGKVVEQDLQSLVKHLQGMVSGRPHKLHKSLGREWVLENVALDRLGDRYLNELTLLIGKNK